MRFKGAFADCSWCGGIGCLACPGEREKAEKKAMEPIFTAEIDNPNDLKLLDEFLGKDALEHAFGPDGDGMREVNRNAAVASFLQAVRVIPESEKEQL